MYLSDGTTTPLLIMPHPKRDREREKECGEAEE
jgi:hypothetical protein